MTLSGTFPNILDEIFGDLMKEARITIDYKGYPCANDDEDDVSDIRIRSVNGFHTPRDYYARVHTLCTNLVSDLMHVQQTLQPDEKTIFMEKVLEKFEPLLNVVTFVQFPPKFLMEERGTPEGLYLFTYPNFIGDKYHEEPFNLFDRILCRACKYSFFWDDAITEVYAKLSHLAVFIDYIPPQAPRVQPAQANYNNAKLRFAGTVPQLACFARVLYENHFFTNTNKSEVCRILSEMFQTKGQDDIAWKSFKNNFDVPPIDAIIFWQEEFSKTMQYSQKLIKKYAS